MKRSVVYPLVLALVLALIASVTLASAQPKPGFKLGFKALADQIPDVVGEPTENEYFNLSNGNSEQHTTRGLMVWRKSDNWTAYTNGYMTWINGPRGVEIRLNTDRFDWEVDSATPTATPGPTATPEPASAPAPGAQETFTLCGGPDPGAEQAIAQLIGGHSFGVRLVGRQDGCADLTVTVRSQSTSSSGSQSANLNISTGSGSDGQGRTISVRIVTEDGSTRVSIGGG